MRAEVVLGLRVPPVATADGAGCIRRTTVTALAYEKDAEAEGGWVAFNDGTVKKLTSAEMVEALKLN
jgi:hypothetical protein